MMWMSCLPERITQMNKKYKYLPQERSLLLVLALLLSILVLLALLAICTGRYALKPEEVVRVVLRDIIPLPSNINLAEQNVIWYVRLPRIIGAILIGGALALAGGSYQSIFQNPLVSPDLLGVSGGACVGAASAILLGGGVVGIQIAAFLGGIMAVAMTTAIPAVFKQNSTMILVLAGVIVSGLLSSIMGILKYLADPESELAEIVYWQMGSLAKIDAASLKVVGAVILTAMVILFMMRWRINVLSLGDKEAAALGVHLKAERGIVILCATMLTASSVCLAGTISWIGLIMPHLARSLVGTDNSRCLPVAAILSAGFLLVIDTAARTLTGAELPLSILTGCFGTPFFLLILWKERTTI